MPELRCTSCIGTFHLSNLPPPPMEESGIPAGFRMKRGQNTMEKYYGSAVRSGTDGQTDATKYIISLASRSVITDSIWESI